MSCVKKEILIGGKGREEQRERRSLCTFGEKGKRGIQKASYMGKPSWSDAQDFMSNTNY